MSYAEFIGSKARSVSTKGISARVNSSYLRPHQSDLTEWALRRGRAAIFADTGLGKSRMQIEWARNVHNETGGNVLILAPLAVADQTVQEGADIGASIYHVRDGVEVERGINITNYDRIHRFDASDFAAVVLDESSIIKHHSAKTFAALTEMFSATPYKLCATATPSPNDWTELGTHAEFLGVMSRAEMLAEFFTHDGGETQKWRLKGHARKEFWKWVASWGAMIRSPADLGHDATDYILPPLNVMQHTVASEHNPEHGLFVQEALSLSDRRSARRGSMIIRVQECAAIVNADNQPWVVWCDLNAEGDALTSAIDGAVQISGSDDPEVKERRLHDFAHGRIRVLVSKPSICGFGLNWQHCARMAFVGVTDSYEAYYQAIRRCWRFGQNRPVDVHVFASEAEGSVVANLRKKEQIATEMGAAMSAESLEAVRSSITGRDRETNEYAPAKTIYVPDFLDAA